MSQDFPKIFRVLRRGDYTRFSKVEPSHVGEKTRVFVLPNHKNLTRLAITVTRRYGKAHERNRFKRVAREAFRLCRKELPVGVDILLKPRRAAHQASMHDVKKELLDTTY